MCLHNRWIQRGEIQGCDRCVVVTPDRFDDRGPGEIVTRVRDFHCGNDEILLLAFPEDLRDDFDLLTSLKEIIHRYTSDTSHLHVIDEAHQFLQETQRQIRIFQTVDSETMTGLSIAILRANSEAREREVRETFLYLKVGDDRVLHIFFLLLKEVVTDSIESVRTKFVFAKKHLKKQKVFLHRHFQSFTSRRSKRIRPSRLICLFSRRPICFDCKTIVRAVVFTSWDIHSVRKRSSTEKNHRSLSNDPNRKMSRHWDASPEREDRRNRNFARCSRWSHPDRLHGGSQPTSATENERFALTMLRQRKNQYLQ